MRLKAVLAALCQVTADSTKEEMVGAHSEFVLAWADTLKAEVFAMVVVVAVVVVVVAAAAAAAVVAALEVIVGQHCVAVAAVLVVELAVELAGHWVLVEPLKSER